MRPELSILIPTKNRPRTAIESIQSCLSNAGDLEVVVQDCSDTRELENLLNEQVNDARVRYFHSSATLSMTGNWNAGMEKVTGEYVTVIGDDDAVSHDLIEAARWAISRDVDSLAFSPCRYYWPDYPGQYAGHMIIYRCRGWFRSMDVNREVLRASHEAGQMIKRLPKLYHGLIRTELLKQLRSRTGVYFDGRAPDYYIRFALLGSVTTHYRLDYPMVTVGCSGPSNSARTWNRNFQAHLDEFRDAGWPPILPPASNADSIVIKAESMIRAFERIDRADLVSNIDLSAVYAACMVGDPTQMGLLFRQYVRCVQQMDRSLATSLARLGFSGAIRFAKHLRQPNQMPDTTRKVARIVPAIGILRAQKERDEYIECSMPPLSKLLDAAVQQLKPRG